MNFFLQKLPPQVVASENGKKPPLLQKFFSSSSSRRKWIFYKPFGEKFLFFQIPLSSSQREGEKRATKSEIFEKITFLT
jgi:hypothetical protein